jgi:hypothetical protein
MPTYDGTEADLMPFLLHLDIGRQDEGWPPATYDKTLNDKQYDLTLEFAQVTELDVLAIFKQRWTAPTVSDDNHTTRNDTCNGRLLAKCLLVSISSDLSMMILNGTPTQYRNDGTYILWAISNNIYRNNIAFVETIREKNYTATLAEHAHDVEKYLVYIKNHLKMISPSTTKTKQHNLTPTLSFAKRHFSTIHSRPTH